MSSCHCLSCILTVYSSPLLLCYCISTWWIIHITLFWETFPPGMGTLSLESFQQKKRGKREKKKKLPLLHCFKTTLGVGHNYPHSAIDSQFLAEAAYLGQWKSIVLRSDVRTSLDRRKKESVSKEQEENTRWGLCHTVSLALRFIFLLFSLLFHKWCAYSFNQR